MQTTKVLPHVQYFGDLYNSRYLKNSKAAHTGNSRPGVNAF